MMNRFGPIAQAVEDILPAHMMCLALDQLYADGYELRLDTRGYLNNSMMTVLQRHTGQEQVIAKKADDLAVQILKHTSFDDAKTVLLAASFLLCKLVEEKLYLDAENQAILTAMMVIADAREDDNPEYAALVPIAIEKAGQMLSECLAQGLYCHTKVTH